LLKFTIKKKRGCFMKNRNIIFVSILVVVALMAYLVIAGAGGFSSASLNSVLNIGSNPSLLLPTSGSTGQINITGSTYNLTIGIIKNGTNNEFITNISIMFANTTDDSLVLNFTISNTTGNGANGCIIAAPSGWNCTNRTFWNLTFDTTAVADGTYNLTLFIHNTTYNDSAQVPGSITHIQNNTMGVGIIIDNTPPNMTAVSFNVSNFTNYTVAGGLFRFNITTNDTTTYVQEVKLGFTVQRGITPGGAIGNNSEFNFSATRGGGAGGAWMAEVPLSTFSDGIYTVRFYANDSLGNVNNSVTNFSFVLDTTGPNVTIGGGAAGSGRINNFTNGFNFTEGLAPLAGGELRFTIINATINDTTSPSILNTWAVFNLTNGSGKVNVFNLTRNTTYWNMSGTINVSALAEGHYNLTIWANDTHGNQNTSERFSFTLDRTAPSLTVTCGDGTFTVGDTVTCTCTGGDGVGTGLSAGPRFSNGQNSEATTATGTGGTSTSCEATDFAGHTTTKTGSWTVTEPTGGSGGSGGSGGGARSGVTGQFEKKVWSSINVGETANMPIANGAVGVTDVSFKVSKKALGAWVSVQKVDTLPSTVSGYASGKVYRNLKITENNIEKSMEGMATIKFKVAKSWLTEHKIGKANVALHRNVNNQWTELKTTTGEDDGTYVHYTAETPGFSYFVVAEKGTGTGVTGAAPTDVAPVDGASVGDTGVTDGGEAPAEPEADGGSSPLTWIIPLFIIIIVGVVIWVMYKRR
jgi:PGF-pre-PGF domain-containing protein